MRDDFDFAAPWGFLGGVAEVLFRTPIFGNLVERNRVIKKITEGEEWKDYLMSSSSDRTRT